MNNIIKVETTQQIGMVSLLAKEIWEEYYTPILGKDQVQFMIKKYQTTESISKQILYKGCEYYLLRLDDQEIGYITIQISTRTITVYNIYIKQGYRGEGWGQYLISFAEKLGMKKKCDIISLNVIQKSIHSIKTYEDLDFRKIDKRTRNIGNGFTMEVYEMYKRLIPLNVT